MSSYTVTGGDSKSAAVAQTIRKQIEIGVLMTLGASELRHGYVNGLPSLLFTVRVFPFNHAGKRIRKARKMELAVQLTSWDDYTISVTYPNKGLVVMHELIEHVYVDSLNRTLFAIDSDKDKEPTS